MIICILSPLLFCNRYKTYMGVWVCGYMKNVVVNEINIPNMVLGLEGSLYAIKVVLG
jgi:hypothetical protein